ncbi:MAG TPA: DUF5698 domain-containing protein [Acidimicrobiia bacterium]|nr:DUF5698 domain-containing protein [Acidimicrobiia bacterium]
MEPILDLAIIFLLRLADVSIGTVRIVLLGRGSRGRAALLGAAESFIWVLAAARVLDGLDDIWRMVAFAGGYGAGTALGVTMERWLAVGSALVRIVAPSSSPRAAEGLRQLGYAVTVLVGDRSGDDVRVSLVVVPRRKLKEVYREIARLNPEAMVTIESTSQVDLAAARIKSVRK